MDSGGPDLPGGSSSEEGVQLASSKGQREFCIKRMYKLMKSVLPEDAQVTRNSKLYMVECAAEFIRVVTSKANNYCQLDQRDTITPEDLINAMRNMGLHVLADYSFRYNQHYSNYMSGQYTPPLPQDVQARVSEQYYALLPPLPLPLPDVQARYLAMAPNFKFSNPIKLGTFSGVGDQVPLPVPLSLPQDVQARVSEQYYALLPPLPLPLPDVQARYLAMAPNFKFSNPIKMGTFSGVGDQVPLPVPLSLPQDVQARVSGQYYAPPPPPLPSQDVEARNFSMAPNFKFPNPIEMGTFFGVVGGVLPPPPLPQDVQAASGQYYAPPTLPLPSQDVQGHNFSMAPNFKFPNPIETGTFFRGDDGEELPPPLLPQDVQAYVSGQYAPPPPPMPPQDDQARYLPIAPNFKFPKPIEMGSCFGDDNTEELPPPPLPQDVQVRVSGEYAPPLPPPPPQDVQARVSGEYAPPLPPPPPPQDVQARVSGEYAPPPSPLPPQDVQARDFPMAPNFMFPEATQMGSLFGDGYGEELCGGGGGDGNSNNEGFDLIAFLNSYK